MNFDWMLGLELIRIFEHYPQNSTFEFSNGTLKVDTLWRIIADGEVKLTKRDHNQQFGIPKPVDAHAEAAELLLGRKVVKVQLREDSGDLTFEFEGNRSLEILNDSSGYEPWNLHGPGVHLVAVGTGKIYDFSPKS